MVPETRCEGREEEGRELVLRRLQGQHEVADRERTSARETHDGVDVLEAVRVEEVLDVLAEEALVRREEVEDVRERVLGLLQRRSRASGRLGAQQSQRGEREAHLVDAVRASVALELPLEAQQQRVDERRECEERLGLGRGEDAGLGRARDRVVGLTASGGGGTESARCAQCRSPWRKRTHTSSSVRRSAKAVWNSATRASSYGSSASSNG